ncbi:MAG: hypothetical protein KAH54_01885 [Candidatus Sabulitectum sp.]|nr:hypothetical protein [Candidatus Sabulitectum sp.]
MRTVINWNVLAIFGVLIVGFVIAGFLVSDDSKTDDGYPLNIFLWGMGGFFALGIAILLVFTTVSNRRKEFIENTWYDAPAEILEVSETGTYINNQPRLKFVLHVRSPVHPPCDVVHKQVIPLTVLAQYSKGATITVKVNPDNPEDILLT